MHPKLYDYFRSSCSYRVRIALHLKNISCDIIPISLLKHENESSEYTKINPQGLVPTWQDESITLGQSLAILEYLDEIYPKIPKLLPNDIFLRAKTRQIAYIIACDMHPLNNLRVKEYLQEHGFSNDNFLEWYHHWLKAGFDSLEKIISDGPYCVGDTLTLADVCLIPQLYNARRFKFDVTPYPKILKIENHCKQLPAFIDAEPKETT